MRVIDLSHPITADMPVYPGDPLPSLDVVSTLDGAGYITRRITFGSHMGTHMDAPAHMIAGGRTLDAYPIGHFIGSAAALDLTAYVGPTLELVALLPHRSVIVGSDFLLLNTGWYHHWGEARYFVDYPVLSVDAALWLAGLGLRGIGVDTCSVDAAASSVHAVHHAFLRREVVIIENLTNLAALPDAAFTFAAFPLRIDQADGSPVRAVGILP
jgi:kynurenine formamidase